MTTTDADNATLAVVVSRIDDLREDIAHMRQAVADAGARSVSRGEWEQRNNYVDSKFGAVGREIGDLRNETHTRHAELRSETANRYSELRAEIQSRRAPWWSVAAIGLAAAGFGWSLLGPAIVQ